MQKTTTIQLRAVCFILLLSGCEAARIQQNANALGFAQIKQKAVDLMRLNSGSPVCKAELMSDPTAALKRYTDKAKSITDLSGKIAKANCIASCPVWMQSLNTRVSEFKSCIDMAELASGIPAELRSLMTGATGPSLAATMAKVQDDLISNLKRSGHFPAKYVRASSAFGTCEFGMQRFDAQQALASPGVNMTAVRGQLFGEDCSSEEAVLLYLGRLSPSDRQMAREYVKMVQRILEIHQRATESGESKQDEITEIEEALEEAGSSLWDSPSGDGEAGSFLEEGLGDGTAIAVIIALVVLTVVCFGILFIAVPPPRGMLTMW